MTLKRNTFEGFAVGVQPTTGTSGGASGDALSLSTFATPNVTGTIVDSPALQGVRALRIQSVSGGTTGTLELTGTNTTSRFHALQFVFRPGVAPSAQFILALIRSTVTATTCAVALDTQNRLVFQQSGGTNVADGITPALSTSSNYLVDLRAEWDAAPSTSNGKIRAQVTRIDDGVVVHTVSVDGVNLNTSLPDRARYGKTGGTGTADFYIDSLAYDDNLQAFIAPVSDFVAPTGLTLGESPTGTVNVSWNSVPTATGYVLERSLSAGSGFAVIATKTGNGSVSHADPGRAASTTYYYRVKATK